MKYDLKNVAPIKTEEVNQTQSYEQADPYEKAARAQRSLDLDKYIQGIYFEQESLTRHTTSKSLTPSSVTRYLNKIKTCLEKEKENSFRDSSHHYTSAEAANKCVDTSLKSLNAIQTSAVYMYYDRLDVSENSEKWI